MTMRPAVSAVTFTKLSNSLAAEPLIWQPATGRDPEPAPRLPSWQLLPSDQSSHFSNMLSPSLQVALV
jgi:hypothetical protein